MKSTQFFGLVALSLLSPVVWAGVTDDLLASRRAVTSEANIKLGRWHNNLPVCRDYCEKNGIPLVAVWSNGDQCGHCVKFENDAMSEPFRAWMKTSGIVYYFGVNGDSYPDQVLGPSCTWTSGGNTGKTLPFIRIYWKKSGTVKADVSTIGDIFDGNEGLCTIDSKYMRPDQPFYVPGDYHTYNPGGRYMINYLTNGVNGVLRKYKPPTPVTYTGGEFADIDSKTVGYQAEIGLTTNITVNLSRTNTTASAKAGTNYLVRVYPDVEARTYTNLIVWAAGQTNQAVSISSKSTREGIEPGEQITLSLLDMTNGVVGVNHITYVAEQPNSPKNPYWIGERTSETLEWGDWSMDLDAVTNKVRQANAGRALKKAHAVVLVGGSCWCPDCAAAEEYVLGRPEFKDWAKKNQVVFGVVDIPNLPKETPSLLTKVVAQMSDRYVTYNYSGVTNEALRTQSGLSYLSRKMIPETDAKKIAERNAGLVGTTTQNGGWNSPDRVGKARTGVPILLVLREDGAIAGRWSVFSDSGPTSWDASYLKRMDELLAMEDEPQEESNNYWQTTTERIMKRGTISGRSISCADLCDVYRISPDSQGQNVSFMLSSSNDVAATLSIVQVSGDTEVPPVATTSGNIGEGIGVSAIIPSTNCFLVVKADVVSSSLPSTPISTFLSPTNSQSTVAVYSILSDSVLSALDVVQEEKIEEGDPLYDVHAVTLQTTAGQSYKITNVDDDAIEGIFEKGESENVYIALTTGASQVVLKEKDGAGTFSTSYQAWNTGRIGFVKATGVVSEPSTIVGTTNYVDYVISLHRAGGSSGNAQATLKLDKTLSSVISDGSIYHWDSDGMVFDWAEGEDFTTNVTVRLFANEFADGNQYLVFKLEKTGGDAGLDVADFILTIRDDDSATPGILAISSTVPEEAKPMTVLAEKGKAVQINLGRYDGADGVVTGVLSTTIGTLDKTVFVWGGRTDDILQATLTIPSDCLDAVGQVVLTAYGAKIDPTRKYLTVKTVEEGAPAFMQTSKKIEATRYVPLAKTLVAVDPATLKGDGEVSFQKCSGQLAPGVTVRYDETVAALELTGTPTQAGSWTAAYVLKEGNRAGLAVSITVDVFDPTVVNEQDSCLECSIAGVSAWQVKTWANVLVFDRIAHKLVGILTVTAPISGRVSAKFKPVDGTGVPMLSKEWESFDAETGAYTTVLYPVTEVGMGLQVSLSVNAGNGDLVELAMTGNESDFDCVVPGDWRAGASAEDWRGYYTVSLPQTNVNAAVRLTSGAGFLTVRMTADTAVAAGKMTYAGMLPNGKSISGSVVLAPIGWDDELKRYKRALLPVLNVSSTDSISGVLSIDPYAERVYQEKRRSVFAYEDGRFIWKTDMLNGLSASTPSPLAAETELDALGGYYDDQENFAASCKATLGSEYLAFFAQTSELPCDGSLSGGMAGVWSTNAVAIKVKCSNASNSIKPVDRAAALAENGLQFSFNAELGQVSGTFTVNLENGSVRAAFKGVVMPGWGATCYECTLGNSEALLRPFISGTAWFLDTYNYTDAKGRVRTFEVRRGMPFSVGTEEGR